MSFVALRSLVRQRGWGTPDERRVVERRYWLKRLAFSVWIDELRIERLLFWNEGDD